MPALGVPANELNLTYQKMQPDDHDRQGQPLSMLPAIVIMQMR